jgi:GxxExxY protein
MNRSVKSRLSTLIFESATEVHKLLGPGLLEPVYKLCFLQELRNRGIFFKKDFAFPIFYKEIKLDAEIKVDLLIENEVIVQIKTLDKITPMHEAHLLTALKMGNKKMGFIFNFSEPKLVDGYKKISIND